MDCAQAAVSMGANCNMSVKGLTFFGCQTKSPAAAKLCNIQQENDFLTRAVQNSVATLTGEDSERCKMRKMC